MARFARVSTPIAKILDRHCLALILCSVFHKHYNDVLVQDIVKESRLDTGWHLCASERGKNLFCYVRRNATGVHPPAILIRGRAYTDQRKQQKPKKQKTQNKTNKQCKTNTNKTNKNKEKKQRVKQCCQ